MNAYKQIIFIGFLITLFIFSTGISAAADAPEPVAGWATVDGNPEEWTPADFFAELYRAGNGPDAELAQEVDVLGDLYLRYDCDADPSPILYMHVMARDPFTITNLNIADDHYLKLKGKTVVNAEQPEGQFVLVTDENDVALGWEAWAAVAEGTYLDFNLHTQVDDPNETDTQTAAVQNRSISIQLSCDPPTAVQLSSVQAASLFDPAGLVLAIITAALLLGTTTLVLWRRQNA